ncbi:MAG: Dabb family protein [Clostridiales bacterium]|nr:MAG: Dabb family protein [Clostridiales bacterium]
MTALKEAEVGRNVNGGDFDITLYTVFESAEDEKAYQTNPLHLEIKKLFTRLCVTEFALTIWCNIL